MQFTIRKRRQPPPIIIISLIDNLTVTIARQEPHLYLGPRPVTLDKLEQEFKAGAEANPRLKISVRPDGGAPIEQLVKVMDAAKAAGIKDVSMFTKPAAGQP